MTTSPMDEADATKPLISVVIPTCHRNEQLARCLERLAPGAQTLPADRYEVIVSDDGTRSTAEELIQTRFPWVRWRSGPKRGPAANRNSGSSAARGEWIAFTDDDCVPAAQWLSEFEAARVEGIDIYEGKTTCEAGLQSPLLDAPINLNGNQLWSCNLAVKASVFREMQGYDEDFAFWCEDLDFRGRAANANLRHCFVPTATVDHPPRPRKIGRAAADRWKAHVQLWAKQHSPIPSPTRLALLVAKTQIKELFGFPLGPDTPKALAGIAVEVFTVLSHTRSWTEQYSRRATSA
jgi:GT2 family glycosyltransferase